MSAGTKATQRRWDEYDAYLFDIDGTLLHCSDAVHYFAFCEALTALAGRALNLDGVTAHGNTDVGILRDALTLAGIPDDVWRPELAKACQSMCKFVEERKGELCVTVLPQVTEVLAHLRGEGRVLGVATGNLHAIGRLKLERCGLLEQFVFGAYSDDFEYRSDVFTSALSKAQALAGHEAAVCVVGDTPEDIRAAHSNGLDVIAVATGTYTFSELSAELPNRCVRSMGELFDE